MLGVGRSSYFVRLCPQIFLKAIHHHRTLDPIDPPWTIVSTRSPPQRVADARIGGRGDWTNFLNTVTPGLLVTCAHPADLVRASTASTLASFSVSNVWRKVASLPLGLVASPLAIASLPSSQGQIAWGGSLLRGKPAVMTQSYSGEARGVAHFLRDELHQACA